MVCVVYSGVGSVVCSVNVVCVNCTLQDCISTMMIMLACLRIILPAQSLISKIGNVSIKLLACLTYLCSPRFTFKSPLHAE